MKPVIQEEISGCGIAVSAAIAGISYQEAKKTANSIGIYAEDKSLWSDTECVLKLLSKLGIQTGAKEVPFENWRSLPDCALLSIKWHLQDNKPFWHWVVFVREGSFQYVLDSKKALKKNIRTDFGRIKPKWYIEVIA
jgi:hypothetical protein